MLQPEVILGGVILVSLVLYTLLGGADFGAGVWDLLASGPRAQEQRALIADAIGPIWEANHVWLILILVLLWSAFPPAYAAITTALFIPLTLMLVGIVLRGSAFTFRAYDSHHDAVQRRWSRVFAVASVVTPMLLGITLGAVASGRISVQNAAVTSDFVSPWLAPFPLAVGAFTLALFAYLAAVYLTVEARDAGVREDFRRRALGAAVAVGILAWLVFLLSGSGAPEVRRGLSASAWAWPLQIVTALVAVGAIVALLWGQFFLARLLAAGQVTLIVLGLGLALFPYLVVPEVTIFNAAASPAMLRLLIGALIVGGVLLFPSFFYLFRVFKGQEAFVLLDRATATGQRRGDERRTSRGL